MVVPFMSDETLGWFPSEGRALLTAPLGPETPAWASWRYTRGR